MNFRGSVQIVLLLVLQSLRQRVSNVATASIWSWVGYQNKTRMLLASLSSPFFASSLSGGLFLSQHTVSTVYPFAPQLPGGPRRTMACLLSATQWHGAHPRSCKSNHLPVKNQTQSCMNSIMKEKLRGTSLNSACGVFIYIW